MHEKPDCCGSYIFGPIQNDRRILENGILYVIHGEGDEMHCTFEDQVMGRTGECPDPPASILQKMEELRKQ